MLFSSLVFLWFFLPAAVFIYYMATRRNPKKILHLAATHKLNGLGGTRYLLLVLLTALLCYAAGLCLDAAGERTALKKLSVGVFVLITLGILGYFKYYNFFAATAGRLAGKELFRLESHFTPSRQSPMLWMSTAEKALHRKTCSTWLSTSFYSRRFFPDRL